MLVTLELAKQHLQISHSQQDDLIALYIGSAQEYVSALAGLDFYESDDSCEDMLDGGGMQLWPEKLPIKSVTSIVDTETGETILAEEYYHNRSLIFRKDEQWRKGSQRYLVSYKAGYNADTAPSGIKQIILELVTRMYALRGGAEETGDNMVWRPLEETDLWKQIRAFRIRQRVI